MLQNTNYSNYLGRGVQGSPISSQEMNICFSQSQTEQKPALIQSVVTFLASLCRCKRLHWIFWNETINHWKSVSKSLREFSFQNGFHPTFLISKLNFQVPGKLDGWMFLALLSLKSPWTFNPVKASGLLLASCESQGSSKFPGWILRVTQIPSFSVFLWILFPSSFHFHFLPWSFNSSSPQE